MEPDLTRWLKDHLGLRHMSEADLNGLIYHPRHGSLCRRFVKFLAESTLSTKEFPNVNAKVEFEKAKSTLEEKNNELCETMFQLDKRIRAGDNLERELRALKERHEYIKRKEDLLRTTNEALQQMADRSNHTFEQVRQRIEQCEYLNSAALEDIYLSGDQNPQARPMSDREMKRAEERYNSSLHSAKLLHHSIQALFAQTQAQVTKAMDQIVDIKKPNIEDLEALKISDFEALEQEDIEQEEEEASKQQAEMSARIAAERKVVSELKKQYNSRKAALDEQHAKNMQEYADFRARITECESILDAK